MVYKTLEEMLRGLHRVERVCRDCVTGVGL